jgi:hypothetical protein
MATAMVVLRDGPASERGWLGLRLALALVVGGRDLSVFLHGDGAGWALPIDARAWLGGDPSPDLQGLIDDAGAAVLVDEASVAGMPVERRHPGIAVITLEEFRRRYAEADQVVAV